MSKRYTLVSSRNLLSKAQYDGLNELITNYYGINKQSTVNRHPPYTVEKSDRISPYRIKTHYDRELTQKYGYWYVNGSTQLVGPVPGITVTPRAYRTRWIRFKEQLQTMYRTIKILVLGQPLSPRDRALKAFTNPKGLRSSPETRTAEYPEGLKRK